MFNQLSRSATENYNLPKWFLDALNTSCQKTSNLLDNEMSDKTKKNFFSFISSVDTLGIVGFGCRHFDQKGTSKLFTVSADWNKIDKDSNFNLCLKKYLAKELLYVSKNKQSLVTRSEDKIDDQYLKYLSNSSINNSVVFYRFGIEKVEVFYFVCADVRIRDFVISNISRIQVLLSEASTSIKWIMESTLVSSEVIQVLKKEQLGLIFSDYKNKNKNIILKFNDDFISLSLCEIECLSYLQHGLSVPFMAKIIGRSPLTIRDRVDSLKSKFKVKTKKDLTFLANAELLHVLSQFELNKNNF